MDSELLLFLVCVYGGLLFAIAWLSERYGHLIQAGWWRPMIYALSIGVYCSSWTFLGAVGQAAESGWTFVPIYLGPVLLFLLGWPLLRRLLIISSRNKITSIADFIGSRYGKSQRLAAVVTVVLVVGTLPYIALQLRAVGIAWATINWTETDSAGLDYISSLIAAMAMAWFAILFGTRVIDGPDRYRGMITAVAVESVVKLLAFVVVSLLAVSILLDIDFQWADIRTDYSVEQVASPLFLTEVMLAAVAFVLLPRQFHVLVVEYHQRSDLRFTRWLVPLYLALFTVLVLPIAEAGNQLFADFDLAPDGYVLTLPRWAENEEVMALTFIGALSAATGMVVVATVALSIMISNELIVPVWLRVSSRRGERVTDLGGPLRSIRRASIIAVLIMSWALERIMSSGEGLAGMGLISFAAIAQLLPAVIGGLYWTRGHSRGVFAGLLCGMALWFYCLLLPTVLDEGHALLAGPLGIAWLAPENLFYMGWLDPLSHGVFWSLLLNTAAFLLLSRRAAFGLLDVRQADAFTRLRWKSGRHRLDLEPAGIGVQQLQSLMEPLVGGDRTHELWAEFEQRVGHRLLPHDQAPKFAVTAIEGDLAAIIGAVSAHRAMHLLRSQQPLQLHDFVNLVGGSSRQIQFSQNLLQITLETIPQGISVVDEDLKLVAWNEKFQQMFNFPARLLYVGCEIEKIYHYNAVRGYMGDVKDVDATVQRRLDQLRSRSPHLLERRLPTGEMIRIHGTPLDNGGYVTTYTDVSDYHEMLDKLEEARETLEDRVQLRTTELRQANDSLQRENDLRARVEKELKELHDNRSRFLAAASHDLLQPVNAARLFVSALSDKLKHSADAGIDSDIGYLQDALAQVEHLINSLRELSRLGSGKHRPRREHFSVDSLLRPLAMEAEVLAKKQGLEFRWRPSSLWVYSDPHLLRRVLQNFISNALRYTREGRVLLGCRRHGKSISIEVWDTGGGIALRDQSRIFDEFQRLPNATAGGQSQGLGLGLSIADRIARLLGHPLSLDSVVGKGSVFRIDVGLGEPRAEAKVKASADPMLTDLSVLCIDNDPTILAGMQSLLSQWGCRVVTASNLRQALNRCPENELPQLVFADFHLDNETGLDVLQALSYHWQQPLAAIILSADNSDAVREAVQQAGYLFLAKPAQPAGMKTVMRRALRRHQR